jgi:hypothetical protein
VLVLGEMGWDGGGKWWDDTFFMMEARVEDGFDCARGHWG